MGSGLPLLERLERDVVLCAEGYLFELERRGYLQSGPFVPEVVLDYPDAVRELHREFLRAGAEVMVAFTYYGHREKLRMIGREDDLEPLNRNALDIAKEVAEEGDALLAGNICNTWAYDPDDPEGSGAVVRAMYEEQVRWGVEAGAAFILSETIDGHELDEACRRVEEAGADVVGLNCSRGPATMLPILQRVREAVSVPVAAQPVPYRTTSEEPTFITLHGDDGSRAFPVALDPFLLTRFEMADFAVAARDLGVGYIGICCGGAPHHVRSMAEALGRTVPASRYSPAMELHPVLGENVEERNKRFTGWQG